MDREGCSFTTQIAMRYWTFQTLNKNQDCKYTDSSIIKYFVQISKPNPRTNTKYIE